MHFKLINTPLLFHIFFIPLALSWPPAQNRNRLLRLARDSFLPIVEYPGGIILHSML